MSTGPDTASPGDEQVPAGDAAGTDTSGAAGTDAADADPAGTDAAVTDPAQEAEPTPGSDNDGAEAGYSPPSQT